MKDFIVLDTETKKHADQIQGGWDNIEKMELATEVTYSSQLDRYVFWKPSQKKELCKYLHDQLVVTFNGMMFDTKLLLGNDRILQDNGVTENDKYRWYNADIYVEIWRHILNMDRSNYNMILKKIGEQKFPRNVFNLESVASATLGIPRTGKGDQAPDLFQQGKLLELFQFNLQDVRMIKSLYQFIQKRQYIISGSFDVVSF